MNLLTTALMIVLTIGSGCKSSPSSTGDLNAVAPIKNVNFLFVIAQGFYSCTYRLTSGVELANEITATALRDLPNAKNISISTTVVEPCFSGGLLDNGGSEKLYYSVTRPNKDTGKRLESAVEALDHIVNSIGGGSGADGKPMYVYFIGHSHGGWFVMNTVANWHSKGVIRGLFTIDPISYKKCTQLQGIMHQVLLGDLTFGFENPECTRAPSDLESSYSTIAKNASGNWHNYFQTQFSYVHSGHASGALTNREFSFQYPMTNLMQFAHKDILYDDRVWTSIRSIASGDVKKVLSSLK